MPRIRTIKPEFWSSPDTAQASPLARLTYIAMWNWADDYGRGTLNLKELEGFIFPNDNIEDLIKTCENPGQGSSANFRHIIKEVVGSFGLTIYEVDRRTYYAIPSWNEHQRTERKAKTKHPAPEDGKNITDQWIDGTSEHFLHTNKETPTHNAGTSDIGKGKGKGKGSGETLQPSYRSKKSYPQAVDNPPPFT